MEQIIYNLHMTTEAQDDLIQRTVGKESRRLLEFIRRRVASTQDAEDILQDVLFQFVSTMRLEPIQRTAAWLFKVAGNRIIDWYRKHRPLRLEQQIADSEEDGLAESLYLGDLLTDSGDGPEDQLMRSAIWSGLNEALDELPVAQREVFVWHELEGKSFREIALLTGDPVNTLLSRKRYAVLYLRERLRELYEDLMS